MVFETVELAAVRAEEVAALHLATGRSSTRSGAAVVLIDFLEAELAADFRAAGVVRPHRTSGAWELLRTWGGALDDLELDEAMGVSIVMSLNGEFGGRLRSWVFSWMD